MTPTLLAERPTDTAPRESAHQQPPTSRATRTTVAAVATALAGGIHLAVVPGHIGRSLVHGLFFLVAGTAQLGGAIALTASTTRWVRRGIAAISLAIAATWVAAVTVGVPFGSGAIAPEAVSAAGLIATVVEVIAAIALFSSSRSLRGGSRAVFASVTAAVVIGGFAGASAPVHSHGVAAADGHDLAAPVHADATTVVHAHASAPVDPRNDPSRPFRTDTPLVTRHPLADAPSGLAVHGGIAWIASRTDDTVTPIDLATRTPGVPVAVLDQPVAVAVGHGSVWVASYTRGGVTRIDLMTGEVTDRLIPTGSTPAAIAVSSDAVYVANSGEGTVARIDPSTGEVVVSDRVGWGTVALAIGDHALWVVNVLDREVVALDLDTLDPVGEPIRVGGGAAAIAVTGDDVWVACASDGTVVRIDAHSGQVVDTIVVDVLPRAGEGPAAFTVTEGVLWVANPHDRSFMGIDTTSGEPRSAAIWYAAAAADVYEPAHLAANGSQLLVTIPGEDTLAVLG